MMKKILSLFLFLSALVCARAQNNDVTKYVWYKYLYGERTARGQYDTVLTPPSDTTLAKAGIVVKNGQFYVWDGTKYNPSGVSVPATNQLYGNSLNQLTATSKHLWDETNGVDTVKPNATADKTVYPAFYALNPRPASNGLGHYEYGPAYYSIGSYYRSGISTHSNLRWYNKSSGVNIFTLASTVNDSTYTEFAYISDAPPQNGSSPFGDGFWLNNGGSIATTGAGNFSGLRTEIRSVDATYTLTDLDNTIVVTTGNDTIYLGASNALYGATTTGTANQTNSFTIKNVSASDVVVSRSVSSLNDSVYLNGAFVYSFVLHPGDAVKLQLISQSKWWAVQESVNTQYGVFTCTATPVLNCTAASASMHYQRQGNQVFFWGTGSMTGSGAGNCQASFSVPVNSNFTNGAADLSGANFSGANTNPIVNNVAPLGANTIIITLTLNAGAIATGFSFSGAYTIN